MKLSVATPERVALKLPLAGVGARAIAQAADVSLIGLTLLVVYFGFSLLREDVYGWFVGLTSAWRVFSAVLSFSAVWVYWTAFEVAWNGQTPGKRWAKIRVVKLDGSPVGVTESAIRNLLRVIDFAPACYPVGLVSMFIDPLQRRLGDLAAGTVLVREQQVSLSGYTTEAAAGLGHEDLEALQSFLRRLDTLSPEAQLAVARQLAAKLGADPATQAGGLDDLLRFLEGKAS